MSSGMALPQEAARLWADPVRRQEIVAMHQAQVPLREMVRRLGLDDALEADGLGDVIDGLSGPDVDAIREVFAAEATRAGSGGANFPIDCLVDTPATAVRVTTIPGAGDATPVVRVEPA